MSMATAPAPEVVRQPNQQPQHQHPRQNVGNTERWVSVALGSAMALFGLRRMSLGGLVTAGLGGAMAYRGVTGHCSMYKALGINTIEQAQPQDYYEDGVRVEHAFTIQKGRNELYNFWRNFQNLPRFMYHLESVEVLSDTRSRWTAKAPMGKQVSWEAEIIHEVPDEVIAWRSLENTDVHNTGSVRFVEAPHGRGTEVRVVIEYIPPAGVIGKWAAKLLGEEPQLQVREDLRRFKRLMETGEVPTTEGQSRGMCV